ncbi:MAG: hypothetical protein LBM61_07330 [Prevotellaceae bacterium]|jgi:hypothetical protein|nr:hypothetical protein [Prevotellaceae bacterium]
MPRRKKHIINVSQLPCYDAVIAALEEFEIYRRQEMLQYESDFDRVVKELK